MVLPECVVLVFGSCYGVQFKNIRFVYVRGHPRGGGRAMSRMHQGCSYSNCWRLGIPYRMRYDIREVIPLFERFAGTRPHDTACSLLD